MVDTKALLKGFGAASDVAGQIATDKAVNARRLRPETYDSEHYLDSFFGQPTIVEVTFNNTDTASVDVGQATRAAIVSSVLDGFDYAPQWSIANGRLSVSFSANNTGTMTFLVF
jgi:hypothetical protein